MFYVTLFIICNHTSSIIRYTFLREFVSGLASKSPTYCVACDATNKFMMSANIRILFGLQIVFVCLYITTHHYHHCANLSEDIELMKCLSDTFCRVCKIKHLFSVIHYTTYGALCFQFTYFIVMIEKIYTLSYYHHQIGSMNYHPLFRVRSWNNGMRCMSLYILLTARSRI